MEYVLMEEMKYDLEQMRLTMFVASFLTLSSLIIPAIVSIAVINKVHSF